MGKEKPEFIDPNIKFCGEKNLAKLKRKNIKELGLFDVIPKGKYKGLKVITIIYQDPPHIRGLIDGGHIKLNANCLEHLRTVFEKYEHLIHTEQLKKINRNKQIET